jgi:hypothetical protein
MGAISNMVEKHTVQYRRDKNGIHTDIILLQISLYLRLPSGSIGGLVQWHED